MGDGLRTVRVVTTDESLLASARAAVSALPGWELANPPRARELLEQPPAPGDVLLLDNGMRDVNVYELCRSLTGRTRCRTFVVVESGNNWAEPIAHFCGATGALQRPLTAADLRAVLERGEAPRQPGSSDDRGVERGPVLPEQLLRDLTGAVDTHLVSALTDPETNLFNYAFLNYKLEEEFKRAQRFGQPLACVMLGFEGEATEQVLRELAGIFLQASRDTDVLGRFDVNSFLFLLPNTGPDGAEVMAHRVETQAAEIGLRDLVGDPLQIAVGISSYPHPEVSRREDLYSRARKAFLAARQEGGGVVTCA
jgi:diguanylate cyclase (GGDEF)-like protein